MHTSAKARGVTARIKLTRCSRSTRYLSYVRAFRERRPRVRTSGTEADPRRRRGSVSAAGAKTSRRHGLAGAERGASSTARRRNRDSFEVSLYESFVFTRRRHVDREGALCDVTSHKDLLDYERERERERETERDRACD